MSIDKVSTIWPGWQIDKQIGEDALGKTYKATCLDANGTHYAVIKLIPVSVTHDRSEESVLDDVTDLANRIEAMQKLSDCESILKVEDYRVLPKDEMGGFDIFVRFETATPVTAAFANSMGSGVAVKMGAAVLSAMEMYEDRGLTLGEVLEENIYITPAGKFKLADFALSSTQADNLYALNLILYKLLNSGTPLSSEFVPPIGASPELSDLLRFGSNPDPAMRFSSIKAYKNALLSVTDAPIDIPISKPKPHPEPKPKKEKKKLSKLKLIIIIAAALVLLGVGIFVTLFIIEKNNPANKILENLRDGEYVQAMEQYSKMDNPSEKLIKNLETRLDEIYTEYKTGDIILSAAQYELTVISSMNINELAKKIADIFVKIENLDNSQTAFNAAIAADDAGEYVTAIINYRLVTEDDENYNTAKERLATAIETYRKNSLNESSNFTAKNDYPSAIELLRSVLEVLVADSAVTERISEYETEYEEQVLKQADKLVEDKKYDDAKALINDALSVLPENKSLTEKITDIDSLRPVAVNMLAQDKTIDSYYAAGEFTDITGAVHKGYVRFIPGLKEDNTSVIIFDIAKKYSVFSCKFTSPSDANTDMVYTIGIYVDGKLIKEITDFSILTGTVEFSCDIKNGQKLEIRATSNIHHDFYTNNHIAMIDAQVEP